MSALTKAGRWLEEQEPYLATWVWGAMGDAIVEAIEIEMEAILRERGWRDEYEAETADAMNYGQGFADAQNKALDGLVTLFRSDPAISMRAALAFVRGMKP